MSRAVSSALPAIDPPVRELRVNASAIACAAMLAATAAVAVSSDPWRMIMMVLIAPIVEEAAFRAGLQEWLFLHRCRPAVANAATATAFVLAHCLLRGPSVVSLAVAGPALVLGWVYGRYRSLRLCIALHMLMNLIWMTTGQWLASFS